jgi:hypothetical protein
MTSDANPEGDENTTQAPGSERREPVSKKNLPTIRDLIECIRKEREHEIILQWILVLRLQEICLQGSASWGHS